jgi:hypothetical protein
LGPACAFRATSGGICSSAERRGTLPPNANVFDAASRGH